MVDILEFARKNPDETLWSCKEEVHLVKTPKNKLGIKIDIIQSKTCRDETFTIVTQKLDDLVLDLGLLDESDRIVLVDNQDITRLDKTAVRHVLAQTKGKVRLIISKPENLLRQESVHTYPISRPTSLVNGNSHSRSVSEPINVRGPCNGVPYPTKSEHNGETENLSANSAENNTIFPLRCDDTGGQRPRVKRSSSDKSGKSLGTSPLTQKRSSASSSNQSSPDNIRRNGLLKRLLSKTNGNTEEYPSFESVAGGYESLRRQDSEPGNDETYFNDERKHSDPNQRERHISQNSRTSSTFIEPGNNKLYLDHQRNRSDPEQRGRHITGSDPEQRGRHITGSDPEQRGRHITGSDPEQRGRHITGSDPEQRGRHITGSACMHPNNDPAASGIQNPTIVRYPPPSRRSLENLPLSSYDLSYEDMIEVALKWPVYVQYEDTKKIELPYIVKGKCVLGFGTKTVKNKKTDTVYCLVQKVDEKSSAQGLLQRGDLILSLNGRPVHNEKMAKNICSSITSSNQPVVTMVIQRPKGVTPRGIEYLKKMRRPRQQAQPGCDSNCSSRNSSCVTTSSIISSDSSSFAESNANNSNNLLSSLPETHSDLPGGETQYSINSITTEMQKDFDQILAKAICKVTDASPTKGRLFILGSDCNAFARQLIGGARVEAVNEGKLYCKYNVRMEQCNGGDYHLSAVSLHNVQTDKDIVGEGIAQYLMHMYGAENRSTITSYLASTAETISKRYGIDEQSVEDYLKKKHISNPAYKDLEIICSRNISESNAALHVMFSAHSQYVLTFSYDDYAINCDQVVKTLCRDLVRINQYGGDTVPVLLVCCGSSSLSGNQLKEIGTELDKKFACFSSQLIYNEETNRPLFYLRNQNSFMQTRQDFYLETDNQQSGDSTNEDFKLVHENIIQMITNPIVSPVPLYFLAFRQKLKLIRRGEKVKSITKSRCRRIIEEMIGFCDEQTLHDVLVFLHHQGDILYQGGCNHVSCQNSVLETLICIDKENFVTCVQKLMLLPTQSEQDPMWRPSSEKLRTTGIAFCDFIMKSILKDLSEGTEVLAFLELYDIILPLKHEVGTTKGCECGKVPFLIPFYLSETEPVPAEDARLLSALSNTSGASVADGKSVYLDFHCFPPERLTLDLFLCLLANCSNSGESGRICSKTVAHFSRQGFEFTVRAISEKQLMEIRVRSGKHNLESFLRWFRDVIKSPLANFGNDIYHLGPQCPAADCIMYNDTLRYIHVLNLNIPGPIYCGVEQVDNDPSVEQWLLFKTMETPQFLESPPWNSQPATISMPSCQFPSASRSLSRQGPTSTATLIRDIPESLVQIVSDWLNVPLGHRDWTGLAAELGLSHNEVEIYRMKPNPCGALLRYWGSCTRDSIQKFLDIMGNLERLDVYDEVLAWISQQSPTEDSMNSFAC